MIKKASALPPIERIDTHPDKGLTARQAEERAAKGYLNKTTNPNEKTTAGIIAHNLFTFFNIVLFTTLYFNANTNGGRLQRQR